IPRGKVTIVQGDGGLGKSLALLDVAARISTGRAMPLEANASATGDVLILTVEDDRADTIRPRLRAACADLRRIHFVEARLDDEGKRDLSFPSDIAKLRAAVSKTRAALVIVDPLADFVDRG